MAQDSLETTLARLIKEQGSPKKVMQELQKIYPKASKKQIIRAAFAQMIEQADSDAESSRHLQDFAIAERNSGE